MMEMVEKMAYRILKHQAASNIKIKQSKGPTCLV